MKKVKRSQNTCTFWDVSLINCHAHNVSQLIHATINSDATVKSMHMTTTSMHPK